MKALLEYMARNLVDNPEAVQIKERTGRYTVTYELTVAPDETGKVIGRSGRVAKSIRDLMSVAAARQNKRVHIDISKAFLDFRFGILDCQAQNPKSKI